MNKMRRVSSVTPNPEYSYFHVEAPLPEHVVVHATGQRGLIVSILKIEAPEIRYWRRN